MTRRKNKIQEFCEKVAEHIKMADLPGVVLRIFGTKKHGKGFKLHDGKWIGEVQWNPVDEENADPYHVGEFLAASERVERQCPRLEIGKHYSVTAYDPDNNEEIANCIVCAGDEEDSDEQGNQDPFRDLSYKFQEKIMNRVLDEMSGSVEAIAGGNTTRGRRVMGMGSGSNEGLIKLDDGSFVTKEWLMASLVQQRQANRRMEEELGTLRDAIESEPRRREETGGGSGGGGGWMKALGSIGSLVQKFIESRANNNAAGGPPQTGGSGIPMLDQLMGGVAPGFMRNPAGMGQTVGGAGAFEQNNPFGGSLLASMDLSGPGSMGQPEAPMQQPPTVPFGGQLDPSQTMGGIGGSHQMHQMHQMQQPGNVMGPGSMGPGSMGMQNPMMAPSPMMGNQGFNNQSDDDDDYDDYDDYYDEEEEMGVTPETKKLAEALLEELMPVVMEDGANKFQKQEKAKSIGSRILIPLAEKAGISKTQLMVLKMDPATFADCLIASLPHAIKPIIEMKKDEVRPVMISVIEGVKLDS